jgi:dienelactone hydrolase
MKSRVGPAFLVAGAAVFLCACASPDGVSRDSSGVPKGKTPVSQMSEEDWNDRDELARTWNAAKVRIPRATGLVKATMANLTVAPGEKYPLVIYMHGCNGFWGGTDRRVDFLAALGFASIAPDSFAREKVPTSCDPRAHRAGIYRGTLRMRQYEAAHAIERARELPWVDRDNIFLMGLSQGGITAATLEETGRPVNARVIEGWGCHAGWLEYKGLNAAPGQPVLSLVAARDPWFRADYLRGDCGAFMVNPEASGSKSVVFDSSRHELLELSEARDIVKAFLARHRN